MIKTIKRPNMRKTLGRIRQSVIQLKNQYEPLRYMRIIHNKTPEENVRSTNKST